MPADDIGLSDVEKLFDAKLDELLRARCDLRADQSPADDDTELKQPSCDTVTGRRSEVTRKLNVDEKFHDRVCSEIPPIITADLPRSVTNSSVVLRRQSSSSPRRISTFTGFRTTPSMLHKSFDQDVRGPAIRLPSAMRSPVPYIDDEDVDILPDKDGSVGCRIRHNSVPAAIGRSSLIMENKQPQNERHDGTEQQRDRPYNSTQSVLAPCSRCNVELYPAVDDGKDFDNDRRTLAWRKLRNTLDDAVVDLVNNLLTTLRRVDDGQTTSELTRADVERLRRRLLLNVQTALWTSSEPADSSTSSTDKDELQHLRTFANVLLDCSEEDDIDGISDIKKYVMTCPTMQTSGADEVEYLRQQRRQRSSKVDREINVFVLRHGVRIDGLHVSVEGRNDLPVNATQDTSK